MFMPAMDPMADNTAFLAKTMRRKVVLVIALCCAVMMTDLLFGMMFSFNYRNIVQDGSGFITESGTQSAAMAAFGMKLFLPFAALIPAGIASVCFLTGTRRNRPVSLRHTVMTAAQVYAGIFIAFCVIELFSASGQIRSIAGNSSNYGSKLLGIILMYLLPQAIYFVWILAGFVFFGNAGKTMRGVTLSIKGARLFSFMCYTCAITNIALLAAYDFGDFKTGLFYTEASGADIGAYIKGNPVAITVFNVFFIASVICLIELAFFTNDYRKAVSAAVRSIRMRGINMFMNGDGKASEFFGGTYQSPAQQQDAPPQPVQPDFDTVQPPEPDIPETIQQQNVENVQSQSDEQADIPASSGTEETPALQMPQPGQQQFSPVPPQSAPMPNIPPQPAQQQFSPVPPQSAPMPGIPPQPAQQQFSPVPPQSAPMQGIPPQPAQHQFSPVPPQSAQQPYTPVQPYNRPNGF